MQTYLGELRESLAAVKTTTQFEAWVKAELRCFLPHAALLVTLGKLYGVGSVPTHRISVDFPLAMIETLKNRSGALDDPLIFAWFRTEKFRFISLDGIRDNTSYGRWKAVLEDFGMRSMAIHGSLNHSLRQFAVFQFCNLVGGSSPETRGLLSSLIDEMSKAAWGTVEDRPETGARGTVGHPTIALTEAELQIVALLAQGLSNKEIARRRGVSDSTVKTQVQRTGAKLGATRRAEIVALALPMLSPLPAQTLVDYDDVD